MGNNQILKGKRGIVFGALNEASIAWKVAELCIAEGAQIVLTNAPVAAKIGQTEELAKKLNVPLIYADVTKMEDLQALVDGSVEKLGGKLDFVLHSVGMSLNVRKKNPYTDSNYDYMHTTLDISAISFHRLMQTLIKSDAVNEWGSILALTYIAAQRVFPDYGEMADAKSLLESYARSFGYHYGKAKKVRVNTISQSPTKTTAGSGVGGFDAFYNYANTMSPLGNASGEACAEYCISLFSDYTRMVTMQNLFHDGGFSFTGVSQELIETFTDNALGK
jgi:enoyl-[acyl-carrier protein] reductase I